MIKSTLIAAAAVLALSTLLVDPAVAQSGQTWPDRDARTRSPAGAYLQAGAGGAAGAGAGAGGQDAGDGARCTPGSSRPPLGATAPPLDSQRSIYAVDCTKPFDPAGKGNLCCI